METEPKFPPHDPVWEEHIIEALIKADDVVFEKLGGKIVPGLSKRELLERVKKQDTSGAKQILDDLTGNAEIKTGNSKAFEKIFELEKQLLDTLLNDNNDLYTNTPKGSLYELLFRTLEKEYPELGLNIRGDAINSQGIPINDYIAVHTTPYKTDRGFILKTIDDPRVRILMEDMQFFNFCIARSVNYDSGPIGNFFEEGKKLENEGLLPNGSTERIMAAGYLEVIQKLEPRAKNKRGDPYNIHGRLKRAREELQKLNVEPISEEERRNLIEKAIKSIVKEHRGY